MRTLLQICKCIDIVMTAHRPYTAMQLEDTIPETCALCNGPGIFHHPKNNKYSARSFKSPEPREVIALNDE